MSVASQASVGAGGYAGVIESSSIALCAMVNTPAAARLAGVFFCALTCRHAHLRSTRDVARGRLRARLRWRGADRLLRAQHDRRSGGTRHGERLRHVLGLPRRCRRGLGRAFLADAAGQAGHDRLTEWRREWDSNPRYAINVHTLSKRAP